MSISQHLERLLTTGNKRYKKHKR